MLVRGRCWPAHRGPLAPLQHPPELADRLDRMAELTGTAPRRAWRVVRESARRGVTSRTSRAGRHIRAVRELSCGPWPIPAVNSPDFLSG